MTDKMKRAGRTLRLKMNFQKYKRCLAMAKRCELEYLCLNVWTEHHEWIAKTEYWLRWNTKWLKLAEYFRELTKKTEVK